MAFDGSRSHVHDPVLGDRFFPVQLSLTTAISVLGGRRKHLDCEQQAACLGPRPHRRAIYKRQNEEVGLNELA